jgi:hypothetical protein
MRILKRILTTSVAALLGTVLTCNTLLHAGDATRPQPAVENDRIYMFLRLSSPEQIAAFYEARGFPREAIERLRQTCFVMAHVENRGQEILWLELKNWRLVSDTGEIRRLDRHYWNEIWNEIKLPQASRSTFGWTQLPEMRDLQPGEPVGGNIILPASTRPFAMEADFHTGPHKRKDMIRVRFKDLVCAQDTTAQ